MTQRRVLIVDDNVELAENMAEILEEEGFGCEMADSGERALELMQTTAFSLVISDIRMAGMSGVDLLRQVNRRWPETPVVLMTAYARDRVVQDAHRHGALDVLRKPVDLEALCDLVALFGGRAEAEGRSILVVEDDEDLRDNLHELLCGWSRHRVTAVGSRAEALAAIERQAFDFAVLDVRLPDGSGLELARALRERLEERCPTLVIMSAFVEEVGTAVSTVKRHDAPVVEVLRKPFSPAALLSIMRTG
jgi:two-component system, NtrC family, response regulator HydG